MAPVVCKQAHNGPASRHARVSVAVWWPIVLRPLPDMAAFAEMKIRQILVPTPASPLPVRPQLAKSSAQGGPVVQATWTLQLSRFRHASKQQEPIENDLESACSQMLSVVWLRADEEAGGMIVKCFALLKPSKSLQNKNLPR